MKTYSTLLQSQAGAVRTITTNRPDVLNAQSRVLLEELDDAFLRAADDPDVRVIILAGAGKHFSAGHDLGSPQEMEDQKKTALEPGFKGEYRRLWERFFENTMRWRDLPKPTIAQVQGYCIMGGMMIASACDIIIASEDAQFADRAVKWGGSHVQYFSMPWDFGPRKTKELMLTGDALTVDFTVLGIKCIGLNGGPEFTPNESFSFQIATTTQEETDRYWNAIVGNGGQESQCGWCKDKWGVSWQITPRTLTEAMAAGGMEAKRAFDAMMTMKKIDVAKIEKARRG